METPTSSSPAPAIFLFCKPGAVTITLIHSFYEVYHLLEMTLLILITTTMLEVTFPHDHHPLVQIGRHGELQLRGGEHGSSENLPSRPCDRLQ